MNALTKNLEDLLVELHEQRELKTRKRIPSSTRNRIGDLIEVAYDPMQADHEDSGELTVEV